MSFRVIYGHYKKDENFTTVYTVGALYTIARNSGDWNYVPVGGRLATGGKLTADLLTKWSDGLPVGTFELEEVTA